MVNVIIVVQLTSGEGGIEISNDFIPIELDWYTFLKSAISMFFNFVSDLNYPGI